MTRRAEDIPSEEAYLRAYCDRTGRASMQGYDYRIASNFLRLAAIFHGIKGRRARRWREALRAQ